MALPEAGRPIQIVRQHDDHTISLDESALTDLLKRQDIIDKKVVVVSVAGVFRKGKSFLLNFMVKYLRSLRCSTPEAMDEQTWMGDGTDILEGFHWGGGCERVTTGIWFWSEPFLVKHSIEDDVVVLLMDTQGLFNPHSTTRDNATIFALSTLISSVQIYNVSNNIQLNELDILQFITAYGGSALADQEPIGKPFQRLLFLVRDWSHPDDHSYGMEGGGVYLKKRLQVSPDQHPELRSIAESLPRCFESVFCYLMPLPGMKVARTQRFNGQVKDMEEDFRQHLHELLAILFYEEELVIKQHNGQPMLAGSLFDCIQTYVQLFQSDKLPEISALGKARAEIHHQNALMNCRSYYDVQMRKFIFSRDGALNETDLRRHHESSRNAALAMYHGCPKMGGYDVNNAFEEKLERHMEEFCARELRRLESYKKSSKNRFIKGVITGAAVIATAVGGVAVTAGVATGATVAGVGTAIGETLTALGGMAAVGRGAATVAGVAGAARLGGRLWRRIRSVPNLAQDSPDSQDSQAQSTKDKPQFRVVRTLKSINQARVYCLAAIQARAAHRRRMIAYALWPTLVAVALGIACQAVNPESLIKAIRNVNTANLYSRSLYDYRKRTVEVVDQNTQRPDEFLSTSTSYHYTDRKSWQSIGRQVLLLIPLLGISKEIRPAFGMGNALSRPNKPSFIRTKKVTTHVLARRDDPTWTMVITRVEEPGQQSCKTETVVYHCDIVVSTESREGPLDEDS
ncbi:Atlastin-2 [Hypsibius exemplaris]|uniref:Atlastin-2 n=1 Tax=Hypsibius exemplaris TaxID=2072580 RepID=A0A1W0X555_HYPEX|nr:Atlastin-2 [Hypsibius exemplaris]